MTQSSGNSANTPQQMAHTDVQNSYPDVYRDAADLRNNAFAIAQRQIDSAPQQASGNPMAVQDFADAYIAAYRQAVEDRDANTNPQPSGS
ncbi:MAG TPA: hypothetical protein DHW02_05060 [Ktedonobacter sp.]|nr:hypothetical protein [Ktedonobacter sp.]